MRQKSNTPHSQSERLVKDIRRKTRKQYSAEKKIRIVLDGLRGEDIIAEPCRHEGIAQSLYYKWSKEFLEAGKRRLAGDTTREESSGEFKDLGREARDLKECVADLTLENKLLKKSMIPPQRFGEAGLKDQRPGPARAWNPIPDIVRKQIVDLALEQSELSPRELAVTFTDTKGYFISEASVYRLLKAPFSDALHRLSGSA